MRPFLIVFCFLLCFCTKKKETPVSVIQVNPAEARRVSLEAIADTIFVLPLSLPDSVYFGRIDRIKVYDSLLFLHDPFQTKTISVFDLAGKYINQLNKKGSGPGEYEDMDLFTVNPKERTLIINQRYKSFTLYTIPDLKPIKEVKDQTGYMSIESIDNDYFFAVSDDVEKNKEFVGCITLNRDFERAQAFPLDLKEISIWGSEPLTITRSKNEIFYSPPSFESYVYKIDGKSATPAFTIDFGDQKVSENAWSDPEGEKIREEMLMQAKAMGVHDVIVQHDGGSFWYFYKDIQTKHLAFFSKTTRKSKVFTDLRIDGLESGELYPVGVYENYYIWILYPDELEIKESEYSKLVHVINLAKESNKVMLLFFKPNLGVLEE